MIFEAFPDIKKAYELKEDYILFNRTCTLENAESELKNRLRLLRIVTLKNIKRLLQCLLVGRKK